MLGFDAAYIRGLAVYGTTQASPRLVLSVLRTQVADLLHLLVVNPQQFPEVVYTFSCVMTSSVIVWKNVGQ